MRKWNPLEDLNDIQRDISRFFRKAVGFGQESIGAMAQGGRWMPAIDMYAKDGDLMIKAELAGVTPADIDVNVKDNTLTITGERKTEKEVSEKDVYRMETSYGKFARSITLPKEVKAEDIKASYSNGILTVEVPKAAPKEAEEKQVKVEIE
jgi:HSP20 family protein